MAHITQRFRKAWRHLLPATTDVIKRGRANIVIAACLGVILVACGLILTWWISGDLQWETVVAASILTLILGGLAALVRRGHVGLAHGLLLGLLWLLITVDAWGYGLASPAASAYVLPIVLAAAGLGFGATLGVAMLSSASVWLLAWGEVAGWHVPYSPVELSHLTFNAPALTAIFLLVAVLIGSWTQFLIRNSTND